MRCTTASFFILAATLLAPSVAHAHLVNSGLGPFYDGALHLILNPMDLIRLSTLGLFAGAQEPAARRSVVVLAPVAWLLASAATLTSDLASALPLALAATLFLLGAAVALDLRSPRIATEIIAVTFGGLLGLSSGVELRADNAKLLALVGTASVVLVLLLLITSLVASARSFAIRVVCRVLGSWSAATGLLSIGWSIAAHR